MAWGGGLLWPIELDGRGYSDILILDQHNWGFTFYGRTYWEWRGYIWVCGRMRWLLVLIISYPPSRCVGISLVCSAKIGAD